MVEREYYSNMKQLRYLIESVLEKGTKVKQTDGSYQTQYETISKYQVQTNELDDEIVKSIYGASINRVLRLASVRYELEDYLYSKVNHKADNVSSYVIKIDNERYKILSVREKHIDIQLL